MAGGRHFDFCERNQSAKEGNGRPRKSLRKYEKMTVMVMKMPPSSPSSPSSRNYNFRIPLNYVRMSDYSHINGRKKLEFSVPRHPNTY